MKSWKDIYNISNQMLCLSGSQAFERLLAQPQIANIRIRVKRELSGDTVLGGYVLWHISILEKEFSYKYLVSWNNEKYESLDFWLTFLREGYISCQDKHFYNELLLIKKEINESWESISSWVVKNTDYNEIIMDRKSNVKKELLGDKFEIYHNHDQLQFLLESNEIKDKLVKV